MNVLVVSSKYPPEYAGSGLRAHNMYRRMLNRYPISARVIAGSVTEKRNKRYRLDGIPVYRVGNVEGRYLNNWFNRHVSDGSLMSTVRHKMNRIDWHLKYFAEAMPVFNEFVSRTTEIDLVHIFGNSGVTNVALTICKLFQVPVLLEMVNADNDRVEDPYQFEPFFIKWMYGETLPDRTEIVCLSKKLEQDCHTLGYENTWCRPNPIDETKFYFQKRKKLDLRAELTDFTKNDIVLFNLAKFKPRKNQLFLVDVLAQLPEPYKLILAGPLVEKGPNAERDQNYFSRIKERIKQQNLEHRVVLKPEFIEHPERYMTLSDVFVFPSENEAFGTPFLESISCGTPVVTSPMPGVADEFVRDGRSGYISELNVDTFSKYVERASQIDLEVTRNESRNVLNRASTEEVDRLYYEHMCQVMG